MTKLDIVATPADYPFCLSLTQWREHCQQLWGGLIDSTDYRPPSAAAGTMRLVAKTLFGTFVGVLVAVSLPEDLALGAMASAIARTTALRGVAIASANAVVEHVLPTNNPLDDIAKARAWNRYLLENRRRKLP